MDLLADVPSWSDVERNLDRKLHQLNQRVNAGWQSAQDGWNGLSQRVSSGASHVYGAMGGHRVNALRQAMARSYPMIEADLRRKWASIEIEQILPVLLQVVREVALILIGSVAVGTAAGGAAGALAFGVGAAPGAVAGAGVGLEIGNLILLGLGLKAIGEYFYQGLPACLSTLTAGMTTAWSAPDDSKPAGLDPGGGSAARVQGRIDHAAWQLAQGQEQLVLLMLTAIVTYLTRGQVKAGIVGSAEGIAACSAKLQAEISNKQLAAWLARNEQKLLAQPELQMKEALPIKEAEPQTLREFYAKQDPDFVSVEDQVKKVQTFETKGLSNEQVETFLQSDDGKKLLLKMKDASPDTDVETIFRRAYSQVASGSTVPEVKLVDSPLVKIVPEGQSVSPYSPFFTTHEELQAAASSGRTLADSFGLPLASESTTYSIFEMSPLKPTEVFVSKVAPTSELNGMIGRTGEAVQYLTPNRGEWGVPKLIGNIPN
jgi:hypothetical protein